MRQSEFKHCDAYAARIAALRPFPPETLKSLREYYRVGLTYTSNALEGNSLTESETKVVIEDGLAIGGKPLRDVYEATGRSRSPAAFVRFVRDRVCETQKELLRLLGESIVLGDDGLNAEDRDGTNDGIKALREIITQNPGRRATDLAGLLGKSVPTVERYVKALKNRGEVEFRGSKKTGGYWRVG